MSQHPEQIGGCTRDPELVLWAADYVTHYTDPRNATG